MAITRVNPPATPTSITATAVHGWDKVYQTESGSLVDRTSELTDPSTNIDSFAAQNDYIYFSVNIYDGYGQFVDIHVALATAASATISPTFEYSTGDDSWAPLTVVDNTAGFTVDGTITFTRASYPTNTQWKKATKDGSGNTIGDGTARFYVRVKRTASSLATPPQISECGTGVLTASKEYFYIVTACDTNNMSAFSVAGRSDNRSVPSAEVSATTTTIKRSIKVEFDKGSAARVIVWRTPTSGLRSLYRTTSSAGQITAVSDIDLEIQTVKGRSFAEYTATTSNDVVDDGMVGEYAYNATYIFYNNYRRVHFMDVERGTIIVDETSANFYDIWEECQANGWDDALIRKHYEYATDAQQIHKVYHLNDNLDIKGTFADAGVTLTFNGQLSTYNSTSVTFGRRIGTNGGYGYDTGVHFIMTADICFNPSMYFRNTIFYSCKFIQASINSVRIYAKFPIIDNNCQLYDCMLDGYLNFEAPKFIGDNIILENVIVSQTRYGLEVGLTALSTISMTDVIIQGGTGFVNPGWSTGTEFTLPNFEFRGVPRFFVSYNATSNDGIVTINILNPTFKNTSITTGLGGENWIVNEQYHFSVKVLDANGDPIEGATVAITDQESTVVTDDTDSSGDVTELIVNYKRYTGGTNQNNTYHQWAMDDVTTLSPHTLTISKPGYQTYTSELDMSSKKDLVIKLEKAVDAIVAKGQIAINTDPNNPQSDFFM